ncbi:MAG: amidohydrolase [Candidatus Omnitrophota bacterium]|nr:MAG: amidohydrolase [Candidatus Omnitrophota bacterium]
MKFILARLTELISFCIICSLASFSCESNESTADLVLLDGNIITVDATRPHAQALAVKEDRILAVGGDEEIKRFIGPSTRVIDLGGKTVVPGFIEGHAHLTGVGQARMQFNLMNARNWDEIIEIVKQAADKTPTGEWITGRGWHQEKWDALPQPNIDGCPTHHALSAVTPDHPVLLTHASGHMIFANANAMQLAGVTRETRSPSGGFILKDEENNPIGMFRESAASLIYEAKSKSETNRTVEQMQEEQRRQIETAIEECIAKGITTFHDAGSSFALIDQLKQLATDNRLKLRLWVMISEDNRQLQRHLVDYKIIGWGNHRLTVRAIKRFIDGALGTHGAWLLRPYHDLADSEGLNVSSIASLKETARLAIKNGFQLCTHAIGDRANREMLNIYEETFQNHPEKKDLRWRIEHAQHLHPADIPRFGQLGVIAAMQGCHCPSDAPFVITRLGEKRAKQGAYAWRSLIDNHAMIVNGTDAPVEDVSPIQCFHASVTRRLRDGAVFFPEQRMSREEALRSYTINAAYAAFEEEIKGSLTPGKLADITILSKDILTIPDEELLQTEVLYTIIGGQVVYAK